MAKKIPVKLILELQADGLSIRQIAATRKISHHSVSEVFHLASEQGISYQDIRELSPAECYRKLFPEKHTAETLYRVPEYEKVHAELVKVGVTLKLLWTEYREKCEAEGAIPVSYSKFCTDYGSFTIANRLTNHLEHKPGEKVEIDWSGPTMSYTDLVTGEVVKVYLFVATLPYSQYSYVEPTLDMKMDTFLRCHVHMYEFFGGVPTRTVCDNLKTGVVCHPKSGEIVLTDDYEALGSHYMTAIMPAGVRKPKQKASVEGTVGKIATAIIARLRDRQFHSFEELKAAVARMLDDFNRQPFQKRDGSRYTAWQEEKPYLHELPTLPYEIARWEKERYVNLDFHVVYRKNRYSCPYQYSGRKVDLRITDATLEIYHNGERLTTHNLFPKYAVNRYSTHQEDMPPAFREIVEWDDEGIRGWAGQIGRNTVAVIERIFQGVRIKEQGYNPSLAVLRLSKAYSETRLESACELAISRGITSPRYRHLKAILAANQDLVYENQKKEPEAEDDGTMGYLRGSSYYEKGGREDA